MKIETRFNTGDKVYIRWYESLLKAEVEDIRIDFRNLVTVEGYRVLYAFVVLDSNWNNDVISWRDEGSVYSTIDEAMESDSDFKNISIIDKT